jgi:hypothetical protein
MHVALGFAATSTEYRFVLQSDVSPDQPVVVRVENIAELRKKQAKLLESVSADINSMLSDPSRTKRLASLASGDPTAADELVGVVRNAITRENPGLPESAQWVLTANLLSASNWPQLAVNALRRAEKLSPGTAKSSSTRWLAGAIAAQSGEPRVFATAETPNMKLEEVPKADILGRIVEGGQEDTFHQTAVRLQRIPSLKSYGLSLEGDLWAAKGDKQAAQNAYLSAASLGTSPSLSRRITELESPKSASKAAIDRERQPSSSPSGNVPFRSEVLRDKAAGTEATQPEKR